MRFKLNSTSLIIYNVKGITIMETLVSIGIASVVGLAMVMMVTSQNKEVAALTEKLVVKDLETRLQSALTVDNFCSCLFRNSKIVAGSLVNPPANIPNGFNQPIPNVPIPCTPAASKLVPSSGEFIPGSKVKISDISFANVVQVGARQYSANLNVNFDTSSAVRSIKGIKTSVLMTVNGTGDFLNCGTAKNSGAIAIAYRGGGFTISPSETGIYQVDFIGSVRGRTEGETYIWMTVNGGRNPSNATEARCGHRDAKSGNNTFIHCPFHMTEFWSLSSGNTYNFSHSGSFPGGGYLLGGGASDAMWIVRKKQ